MNEENGKKNKVLILDVVTTDQRTGVEVVSDYSFTAWGDAGNKNKIMNIEGVTQVYDNKPEATKYHVCVDPRYDFEFVKKEVEAVLMCS